MTVNEDYEWFISELDTSSFKGKYIAIWNRMVVGVGENAVEVERLAKHYHGSDCSPLITYIPTDEQNDCVTGFSIN